MITPADQPDLIAWLRQQLDDEERDALNWHHLYRCEYAPSDGADPCSCNGPARVRAEVDAKRRILDEHERVLLRKGHGADYYVTAWVCKTCGGLDSVFSDGTLAPGRAAQYPCRTLRLLALPYANGPGYREEWKP
ncbi:DUF6221 family protein [Micromonospora chersina]